MKGDGELDASMRIVLLYGAERFLQELLTQRLREVLEKAHGQVDVIRFDGNSTQIADVLDECRSMGLMQQHKMVVVDGADQFVKEEDPAEKGETATGSGGRAGRGRGGPRGNRQILESYAEAPVENATLVLRADKWHPGNLDKAIAKVGFVRKCERESPEKAAKWAIGRCAKRYGTTIEPEGARILAENLGGEYGRIDSELAKLSLLDPGKPITADQVREMVGITREEKFWAIQETLLTGNAAAALAHLRDLLEISRTDPVPLTWTYIDLAQKLHGVCRALRQGENPGAMFKRFRLWGPSGDAVMRAAKKLDPAEAAELLQAAIDTDVRQKTSAGDPVRGLEMLTLRFASVVK